MSKIRIKNFGPIKEGYLEDDGFLEIKKVTIFIGNQGSGKSTVAKLISIMTWFEKSVIRGKISRLSLKNMNGLSQSAFYKIFKYQGIDDYISQYSEVKYHDNKFLFSSEYSTGFYPEFSQQINVDYILPKIAYIPAERNMLSTINNIYGVTGMPDHLFSFSEELRRANKELKGERLKLPINDYEYEYDEETDSSFVVGLDYKINILNASSGIQSSAPLYVVTRNLAHLVTQSDEIIRKNMNSESILRMNEEMATLEVNDSIPENEKVIKRKEIKAKYLSKCFINIVEEPEQNLYPTSQRHILNSLLEFNNLSEGNKLIMTTHSPYIINYLSLAIQAGNLKDKIQSKELLERLNSIVPLNSTVKASDVAIYQLDEKDGSIRKLPDFEGIPSDNNLLNLSLAEGNELFRMLLDIEDEL
jgi:Fe-S cluster assembly ATPase SufC